MSRLSRINPTRRDPVSNKIIANPADAAKPRQGQAVLMADTSRDVLSPREVADRAGFSYHAILRAIRRGDLQAFEPVPGHYRIELLEYERWLRRPARGSRPRPEARPRREREPRVSADPAQQGSVARLRAIESSG